MFCPCSVLTPLQGTRFRRREWGQGRNVRDTLPRGKLGPFQLLRTGNRGLCGDSSDCRQGRERQARPQIPRPWTGFGHPTRQPVGAANTVLGPAARGPGWRCPKEVHTRLPQLTKRWCPLKLIDESGSARPQVTGGPWPSESGGL